MEFQEILLQLRQPRGASRTAEVEAAALLVDQADQIAALRDKVQRLEWRVEALEAREEQQ